MPLVNVTPNVISYSASISACEKGSQWQQALALLQHMPRAQVLPNLYAQNSTISSCEKAMQWQVALAIFDLLEVSPDVAT
eukprot:Skav229495  [mRNA]  locus=scaffold2455:48355:48795:- [translate_table: standard]